MIVPQALVMVTPEKVRQYFNNCLKICALCAGDMTLSERLVHDQQRKNLKKRVGHYVNLLQRGEDCKKRMCVVMEEL